MNAFFFVLLVLTAAASVLLLLTIVPRKRPVLPGPSYVRLAGLAQLLIGVLWVVFGGVFLHRHGLHDGRGWYAIVLGALWAWQAARRLTAARPR